MSRRTKRILEEAKAKGKERMSGIIREAGGLLTTDEAATAAGLLPQELLARKNRSILAVPTKTGTGWPRFQFESPSTLHAVGLVLKNLDIRSPWMQLNFFLLGLEELGGIRPIDAIRAGNVRNAERAASHFGRHGAT